MNNTRVFWCAIYFLIGVGLLSYFTVVTWPALGEWVKQNHRILLWCYGWPAIGIGLGLWNSRNERSATNLHYVTYFVFVLFIAGLAALTGSQLKREPYFYIVSALTGIVVGFSGDSLAGIISKLSAWFPRK